MNNFFKHKLTFLSFGLFSLCSCDMIGDDINENDIPLTDERITSVENIALEQGDRVVFWLKVDATYDEYPPALALKYNIDKDGESIQFQKINPFEEIHGTKPKIFSSYEKEDSSYTKESYEMELTQFPIKQSGEYTFDFKLDDVDDDFPPDSYSIILRKL